MSRRTFAVGRSTATPSWNGKGVRPDGWEGWDDGWDIYHIPFDDPDAIAAAMDAAKEADQQARERIMEYQTDIPPLVLRGLTNYVNYGVPVGEFLTAVLENNLANAVAYADVNSLVALKTILMVLHNEAPLKCWRHPDRVAAWLRMDTEQRAGIIDGCPSWQRFMEVTEPTPTAA